jgi:DNA-binding MarR family transcriptional regulator
MMRVKDGGVVAARGDKGKAEGESVPALEDQSIDLARRILAMRRLRDRLLGAFFAEPAWDILLELYVQTHEDRTVTVSQLSLSTGAPPTTALRWINTMAREGLLVRRSDDADARRVIVSLSREGEESMRLLLASVLSELETPMGERAALDGSNR